MSPLFGQAKATLNKVEKDSFFLVPIDSLSNNWELFICKESEPTTLNASPPTQVTVEEGIAKTSFYVQLPCSVPFSIFLQVHLRYIIFLRRPFSNRWRRQGSFCSFLSISWLKKEKEFKKDWSGDPGMDVRDYLVKFLKELEFTYSGWTESWASSLIQATSKPKWETQFATLLSNPEGHAAFRNPFLYIKRKELTLYRYRKWNAQIFALYMVPFFRQLFFIFIYILFLTKNLVRFPDP